jgi:hypothetical protein
MSRKKDAFSFIYGDKAIAYHVIWTTENKAGKITIKGKRPTAPYLILG